jgi:hypothetical protein
MTLRVCAVALVVSAGCGDDPLARTSPPGLVVGVVPYGAEPDLCQQGTNRESVSIRMDDENDTRCSYESGDRAEGRWVSPHAAKYPLPPTTEICDDLHDYTWLRFCRTRVDADAFRPLTSEPHAREQFYAILRFGDSCPEHSIEISKTIVNEDVDNENQPKGPEALELLHPNEVAGDAFGNYTKLHFCFFRNAPTEEETMSEFPDLGFPYAVFHDFEGSQPGWVMKKRWQYSDDSNQLDPVNSYSEADADFMNIVENPLRDRYRDTCLDFAQVR